MLGLGQGLKPRVLVSLLPLLAAVASAMAGVTRDPYLVSRGRPNTIPGGGGLSITAPTSNRMPPYRTSLRRKSPRRTRYMVLQRTVGFSSDGGKEMKWRFLGYLNSSSFGIPVSKLQLRPAARVRIGFRAPPPPGLEALAPAPATDGFGGRSARGPLVGPSHVGGGPGSPALRGVSSLKRLPDWDYNDKGPRTWATQFPGCAGRRQSPIDIQSSLARISKRRRNSIDLGPATSGFSISYDGSTVKLTPDAPVFIMGIGMYGEAYTLSDIHFHWASDSYQGSEHSINGIRFPMEMHITAYLRRYGSKQKAMQHNNGIAALSIMFQIGNDNPSLRPILSACDRIQYVGDKVPFPTLNLRGLLPAGLHSFFRYAGSMTTPPCSENVLWTVCNNVQTMSLEQFRMFQDLRRGRLAGGRSYIVDNCRPVQPSYDRPLIFDA